ncbi:hypothetical protein GCM10010911_16890 [Paenibacillus nasutitermitis]|uniref:Histidine kinase/HSP90-like ATPase domain-containing protein n=1 Tax=Paenibacillus nasutitermitis TaxID=1652958 RepID=A0A916YSL6_9BACL|nr:hypothetical protein GCM10010911_16890 [Paenibacillus nasutitermitis]
MKQNWRKIRKPENSKKGVGLWNINQRIQLLYGNRLRIESAEGRGTKVSFHINAHSSQQIGG